MGKKRNPKNKKALSEEETRKVCFETAAKLGCTIELKMLFSKFDTLLSKVKNESESKHIKKLAAVEIYHLLFSGGLTIDGEVVIPSNEETLKI